MVKLYNKTTFVFRISFLFTICLLVGSTYGSGIKDHATIYEISQDTYNQISPIEEFAQDPVQKATILANEIKTGAQTLEEEIRVSYEKLHDKTSTLTPSEPQDQHYSIDREIDRFYSATSNQRTRRISILSLDGGGIRGALEAYELNYLERIANRKLHHLFDFIAGTSIGGILALGATVKAHDNEEEPVLSTTEMINIFKNRSTEIFPKRAKYNYVGKIYDLAKQVYYSRYDDAPLTNLLVGYFRDRRLNSTLTNVVITTAINEKQQSFLFNSYEAPLNYYMAHEVGRATSAAPTYFNAYPLVLPNYTGFQSLTDGGLWYNNPALIGFKEALKWAKTQEDILVLPENTIMLSLGTGLLPIENVQPRNAGWLNSAKPLIESMMNISSHGIDEIMKDIFPENNYKRINPRIDEIIKLDNTDIFKTDTFEAIARTTYDEIDKFVREDGLRLILEEQD